MTGTVAPRILAPAAAALLLGAACAARPDSEPREPRTVTIDDRFAGPSLDPAWSVSFTNPGTSAANTARWIHDFADGALAVTHIEPATLSGAWSYVSLSRPLGGPAADFSLSAAIGWESVGVTDMTNVFLTVYADDGSVLGHVGYHDAWTASRGEWIAIPRYERNDYWPATRAPGWADWRSGPGSLGDCGAETLTVARTAGVVSLRVGGREVLSYAARKRAARVEVAFGFAYHPDATMGALRLERLTGTATLVPAGAGDDVEGPEPPPAPRAAPVPESPAVPPPAPSTAETPAAPACAVEASWFTELDGTFEKEERIDGGGAGPDVLVYRYGPISDSGVELERRSGETVLWRVHVQPLGIPHSKYRHDAKARVEGGTIVVDSIGARHIVEIRDLATGRQLSREVFDVRR